MTDGNKLQMEGSTGNLYLFGTETPLKNINLRALFDFVHSSVALLLSGISFLPRAKARQPRAQPCRTVRTAAVNNELDLCFPCTTFLTCLPPLRVLSWLGRVNASTSGHFPKPSCRGSGCCVLVGWFFFLKPHKLML